MNLQVKIKLRYLKMKIFVMLALFLLNSQFLNAQFNLNGIITDKATNEKLAGAFIFVQELNKGTIANNIGEFTITGFGAGNYNVQISYAGYQTKIEKIKVIQKEQTLNVQLDIATIEVNEVVISGSSFQDENSQEIDVVRKSEMQQTGANTVMDIITKVSGVNAITTGPLISRPVIRGLSGNRILTVVDGVRFETQQWDDEHGIGINELGVDRIEIVKGPASLLYGPEAMGGVIHFIEEQPAAVGSIHGNVNGSASSNNMGFSGAADLKGATDKYNWSFNALGKMLPDYYFDGYRFRAPNTRLTEAGARASFGISRVWGSSTVSYQLNQAYFGILDGKDIVKNPDGSIANKDTAEMDMFPSEIEAPYHAVTDHKISSKTILHLGNSQLHLIIGYQNNHRAEFEDNGTKVGYDYMDVILQSETYDAKWYLPAWNNLSVILGTQGMIQQNKNSLKAATQLVPDATINDLGFVALTKYNLKRLNFSAGARYDSRNLNTEAYVRDSTVNMPAIKRLYDNFSGSIGATYDIEDLLVLRVNYASGYRTPNLNELMSDGVKLESQHYEKGNLNFEKEQNNEIDVSAIIKNVNFTLEGAAYKNNIRNYIYLEPTGNSVKSNLPSPALVPEYQFFQDNAQIQGGEAGLNIHPKGFNWIHYEIKAATLKGIRTNDKSYLPMMPSDKIYNTLFFNVNNRRKFKDIFARIGIVTALTQNKVAAKETSTSGYTLLNLSFGATTAIRKVNRIEFSLAINNVFDKVYIDNMSRLRAFGISNPGRNISLNLRIPLEIKNLH